MRIGIYETIPSANCSSNETTAEYNLPRSLPITRGDVMRIKCYYVTIHGQFNAAKVVTDFSLYNLFCFTLMRI